MRKRAGMDPGRFSGIGTSSGIPGGIGVGGPCRTYPFRVRRLEPDLDRFPAADQATIEQFATTLDAIVENGQAAFGNDDA